MNAENDEFKIENERYIDQLLNKFIKKIELSYDPKKHSKLLFMDPEKRQAYYK